MSSDNSTAEFSKTRRVLGDITNQPLKRGFSMMSADSKPNSGDGHGENVDCENQDSKFAKKVSLAVESAVREKCKTKIGAECDPEEALSSLKGTQDSGFSLPCSAADESLNEDSDSVTLTVSNDIGDKSTNTGDCASSTMEVGVAFLDNCSSMVSNPKCRGQTSDVAQSIPLHEGLVTVVRGNEEKDLGHGSLHRSQGGSKSHEYENLERCRTLRGDGNADLNGVDGLVNCSCSFCLKAAHILSDLQYQDVKGRVAALKKSKKEARMLVEKSFRGKGIDAKSRPHPNKGSELEYNLSSQWRSLFLHVEDMLVHESNHLQESCATLKGLRDHCKTELEMTGGVPAEKQ